MRHRFEGREAIYVHKGALRVRVSLIDVSLSGRRATALVEELPTPGFEQSLIHAQNLHQAPPLRWRLMSGFLTKVSETAWTTGYGGWSLYFEPRVVQGIVELAAQWPSGLDAFGRYNAVLRWLSDHGAYGAAARLFPEPTKAE